MYSQQQPTQQNQDNDNNNINMNQPPNPQKSLTYVNVMFLSPLNLVFQQLVTIKYVNHLIDGSVTTK